MKEDELGLLLNFGKRLKELRNQKGWTLRELEAHTGIDHSELTRFEGGFVSPQLLTLYKISSALKITLSDLFADIEIQH